MMMQMPIHIPQPQRAVLRLSGTDVEGFLQALFTNDMSKLKDGAGLYSALLTPQGKYTADFFLIPHAEGLFLEVDDSQKDKLIQQLTLYRLKSDVTIDDLSSEFQVWVHLGEAPDPEFSPVVHYPDPRLGSLGWRSIIPAMTSPEQRGHQEDYEALRLTHGIPDCARDCVVGKSTAFECNLDLLNGLSFTKGCYVGQEVTARIEYRGKIKKRLMPVTIEGPLPEPGTPVKSGERVVGEIRSGLGSRAIALLRIAHLDEAPFSSGDSESKIIPARPDWLRLE